MKKNFCLLCSLFCVTSMSAKAESQKEDNIRRAANKLAIPKCGIPLADYQHPIVGPKTYTLFKWNFKAKKPDENPIAELRVIDGEGLVELVPLNSKYKLQELSPATANELFGPAPNNLNRKKQVYSLSTKESYWVILALYFEKKILKKYRIKGTLGNSKYIKLNERNRNYNH